MCFQKYGIAPPPPSRGMKEWLILSHDEISQSTPSFNWFFFKLGVEYHIWALEIVNSWFRFCTVIIFPIYATLEK